jgi:hypothetical protein
VSLPTPDPGDALGRFRLGPAIGRVLGWPGVVDVVDLADDPDRYDETVDEFCARVVNVDGTHDDGNPWRAVPSFVADPGPEAELLHHVEVLLRHEDFG